MKIDFLTPHLSFPIHRQISAKNPLNCEIRFGHEADADFLVVYDDVPQRLETHLPVSRRIFVNGEPPGIKAYRPQFLDQFGIVVSPYPLETRTAKLEIANPALPWFYGVEFGGDGLNVRYSIDDLRELSVPAGKKREVSAVLSSKTKLPMHRRRLELVERLKNVLGDRLHVFGSGHQRVADKAEAIDPYCYHLVLENNVLPNFWTEKLADAYLGYALPLYLGCPNVTDFFPAQSLVQLDLSDVSRQVDQVQRVLEEDPWEACLQDIEVARRRTVDGFETFSTVHRWCKELGIRTKRPPVPQPFCSIRPSIDFRPSARLNKRVRHWRNTIVGAPHNSSRKKRG